IRRVPHQSVRPGLNDGLILSRPYVAGEILTERAPAITSQQTPEQDHRNSDGEQWKLRPRGKLPCLHERQRKCDEQRNPHSTEQHAHRPSVLRIDALRALHTALHDFPFWSEGPDVNGPEHERVRPGKRKRSHFNRGWNL